MAGGTSAPVSDPFVSKDAAETFGESDVTVSFESNTQRDGESVRLTNSQGSTASAAVTLNSNSNQSAEQGLIISPNTALRGVTTTVDASVSGVTKAYLRESDGTLLDTVSASSGSSVTLHGLLSAGNEYHVTIDAEGANYTDSQSYEPDMFPVSSADIDIVAFDRAEGRTQDYLVNFTSVTALVADMSGTVSVEWSMPSDVASWDLATYQADGAGTTTVNVTDGGGTTLLSDIGRGADISGVNSGTNPVFEVNLSRSHAHDDPTLHAIYRRWRV